jgi:threonine/homoserine/homoserine lactone efflux protein
MSPGWPIAPEVLPGFLLAMALVELTPGPNMAYLAALSAQRGRTAGFAAVLGISLGLGLYLAAAILGLAQLLLVWRPAYEILRWAGVLFMLWLAWEAWRGEESATAPAGQDSGSILGLVGRGFVANVLNPKAALFYVTLLPGFVREGYAPAPVQAGILGLAHLAISLGVHSLIVFGAATAGRLAGAFGPGARFTWVRRSLAVGIALVAIWLAWQTRRPS